MEHNPQIKYRVLGFVDDDPLKIGRDIHGIRVLGPTGDIPLLANKLPVQEVMLAIPSASGAELQRIVDICRRTRLKFKIVPSLSRLITERENIKQVREVVYEDLLGREPIRLASDRITGLLKDKTILVTGAGGSIGSEICRQICRFAPRSLVVLDRAENSLYEIEQELLYDFPQISLTPVLADFQDIWHLRHIMAQHQPQVVFHAGAYKHVPLMERFPVEAVKNNILGSRNVIQCAHDFGVEVFVLVSTDKAVSPRNIMGASKRVTELMAQRMAQSNSSRTRFITVRFGNVLGSSGSVVPLFKKQIAHGGPITVTDPQVTRYFMSIPEAAQLILQAGSMGEGGETFILNMGQPIKIDTLAREMARFYGLEPGNDIKIDYIGLRPGEKLTEELTSADEALQATLHNQIFVVKGQPPNLENIYPQVEELEHLVHSRDTHKIKGKIKSIVPEYDPQEKIPAFMELPKSPGITYSLPEAGGIIPAIQPVT